MDQLRILICDKRALWRDALARTIDRLDPSIRILETDSVEDVGETATAGDGVDLVVLNIDPGKESDLASLERLCTELAPVPVAVVADNAGARQIVAVLEHGAKGYLSATLESRVMIEALRLVAVGGTYIPELVLELVDSYDHAPASLDMARDRVSRMEVDCTPRQRQVLSLLCEGMPNKSIAHRLNISENTVKAHLRQLMKRLHVSNRTEAVLLASGLLREGGQNSERTSSGEESIST
jgi:DNA-binding NarL/FixJ family response regulator